MTVFAPTIRRPSSSGHAFVVPVVHEVAPQPAKPAAGSAW
jgi:hypothetical protein